MKLYTEEQLREALRLCELSVCGSIPILSEDDIIQEVTHIQLPSDEEIERYLNNHSYEFEYGFKDAIEFIKNKIQGGQL